MMSIPSLLITLLELILEYYVGGICLMYILTHYFSNAIKIGQSNCVWCNHSYQTLVEMLSERYPSRISMRKGGRRNGA